MPQPTVNITCQISMRSYSLETMEQTLRNANESECQRCFRRERSLHKALKMAFTKGASIHPCVSTWQEKSTKDFDLTVVSSFWRDGFFTASVVDVSWHMFLKKVSLESFARDHTGTSRYVKVIVSLNERSIKEFEASKKQRRFAQHLWKIQVHKV